MDISVRTNRGYIYLLRKKKLQSCLKKKRKKRWSDVCIWPWQKSCSDCLQPLGANEEEEENNNQISGNEISRDRGRRGQIAGSRGEKGKRGNSYNNSSKCPDDQYEQKREAVQKMISKKSWRRSKGSEDGKLNNIKTVKFPTVKATAKLVMKTQTSVWPVGGAKCGLTVVRSRGDQ